MNPLNFVNLFLKLALRQTNHVKYNQKLIKSNVFLLYNRKTSMPLRTTTFTNSSQKLRPTKMNHEASGISWNWAATQLGNIFYSALFHVAR